jgi:hypothetical protein
LNKSTIDSNGLLTADIVFEDESCYSLNSVGTLYLTDATGCERTFQISIENPCEDYDFLLTPSVQEIGNLKFRAPVPGKYGPYIFKWSVNSAAFYIKDQYEDIVELGINEGAIVNDGETVVVSVSVTNQYGCCLEGLYSMVVCAPKVTEYGILPMSCGITDCPDAQCVRVNAPFQSCKDYGGDCNPSFRVPIDWSSFRIEAIPSGMTLEVIEVPNSPGSRQLLITAPTDFIDQEYTIKVSVADTNGVRSYAELCVKTKNCDGSMFMVQGGTFLLGCQDCEAKDRTTAKDVTGPLGYEECSGQTMAISIEDRLIQAKPEDIDWSTFTFIPLPGQIMITATQITSDFALIDFDPDRKIVYAPFNAGQNIFENVRFSVKTLDGRTAQSTFLFEDDYCDDAPVAKDDSYQVREGSLLDVNVTVNDIGNIDKVVFQGPLPGPGEGQMTLDSSTGRLKYSAVGSDLPDEVALRYYLVDTQGRVSNTADITIQINKATIATAANRSFCPADAEAVDLYDLLDTNDDTRYWKFKGFEGLEDGTFSYNGNPEATYEAGHIFEPKLYSMVVDFSNSAAGVYTFLYTKGVGQAQVSTEISIEIVDPVEMPEQQDLLVCITGDEFYLENQFAEGELPSGGSWENVTPFGNKLTSTKITPSTLGAGLFRYRYIIENEGEYNDVCESYVDVVVEIANEVYAGEDVCFKVCSAGPDPTEDPDLCRDPRNVLEGEATCEICLWDKMVANIDPKTGDPKIITPHGDWFLKEAPLATRNILLINGEIAVLAEGDQLPSNYQPCIDFGNVAVGKYVFEYVVDYGCTDRSEVIVEVLEQPCQADDVEGITVELDEGASNTQKLYSLLIANLDPEGCLPTTRGYWDYVSGPGQVGVNLDNDGDGTNDYIDGTAEPGTYRFKYTYYPTNVETEYCADQECVDDCDACEREVFLEFEFNPCPDLGEAEKLAVCNSGTSCKMALQELAPNANYNEPGATYQWIYKGFSSTSSTTPNIFEVGNIPDITTTKGSMWAVDEQVLAAHTADANDTDINPLIEWNGATVGFYFFDLKVTTQYCEETLRVVVQVVQVPDPGLDGSCLDVCDNAPECIDLWCLLTGTPGTQGQWSFVSGIDCDGNAYTPPTASGGCAGNAVAGACDPCGELSPIGDSGFYPGIGANATFNTDGIPCGTYVFRYVSSVPPLEIGFDLYACTDGCDPREAEVTITILDGDDPGPGGGAAACN